MKNKIAKNYRTNEVKHERTVKIEMMKNARDKKNYKLLHSLNI